MWHSRILRKKWAERCPWMPPRAELSPKGTCSPEIAEPVINEVVTMVNTDFVINIMLAVAYNLCVWTKRCFCEVVIYLLLKLRSPRYYVRSSVVRSRLWHFLSPLDGASVRERIASRLAKRIVYTWGVATVRRRALRSRTRHFFSR